MNSLKKFSRVKIGVETIEEYVVKAFFSGGEGVI